MVKRYRRVYELFDTGSGKPSSDNGDYYRGGKHTWWVIAYNIKQAYAMIYNDQWLKSLKTGVGIVEEERCQRMVASFDDMHHKCGNRFHHYELVTNKMIDRITKENAAKVSKQLEENRDKVKTSKDHFAWSN